MSQRYSVEREFALDDELLSSCSECPEGWKKNDQKEKENAENESGFFRRHELRSFVREGTSPVNGASKYKEESDLCTLKYKIILVGQAFLSHCTGSRSLIEMLVAGNV